MTRINVVPVQELTRQHLVAEYRELPRVFALAHKASAATAPWTHRQPQQYTLGTGHVLFFYDKLAWCANRQQELIQEMLARGYNPKFASSSLTEQWQPLIPTPYWKDYTPTLEAIVINQNRIAERTPV